MCAAVLPTSTPVGISTRIGSANSIVMSPGRRAERPTSPVDGVGRVNPLEPVALVSTIKEGRTPVLPSTTLIFKPSTVTEAVGMLPTEASIPYWVTKPLPIVIVLEAAPENVEPATPAASLPSGAVKMWKLRPETVAVSFV